MNVIRDLAGLTRNGNTVVTVGTFDGVHLAHQEIVREVVNRAKMREGRSVVVTFDPHPKEVVGNGGGPVKLLTTLEERVERIAAQNVDTMLVLTFTREFSRMSPREFYGNIIVRGTGVSEVVVGYDHMFGRDRAAGTAELMALGREFDFSVFAVHPFTLGGEPVSSTRIRRALFEGDVSRANNLLGYPYRLTGKVVEGDRRGRSLGYPTANLAEITPNKLIPARGVYVVSALAEGREHFGMLNIGVRPTVADGLRETIEVHLLSFDGDLYGSQMTIRFLERIRDERKFASLQDLVAQLDQDKERAVQLVETYHNQR